MLASDTVLRDDRHRPVRRVIDDHQHLERPARRDTVKDEVHRPGLVGGSRTHERLPISALATLTLPGNWICPSVGGGGCRGRFNTPQELIDSLD